MLFGAAPFFAAWRVERHRGQAVRDGAVVVLAQLHDQSQDDLGEADPG